MKSRKIPMRKCVSCGQKREKKDLLRIVNNKEQEVSFDETGKKNGRGAYICKSVECIDKAKKSKRLNILLDTEIDSEFYEKLKEYIQSV
ncbi:hypothetical protein HMPREF3188_00501 [Tissierellia bacterium KA00581]|jgi:hypothetical protein|nr:hypothetical protein HMPREF3188_00501 [Tissierellia bacterium KA00581]